MKRIAAIVLAIGLAVPTFGQVSVGPKKKSAAVISYNNPQEYEIAEITVEGTEYLDHNSLISLSGLRVGDQILVPGPEISQAIKKLWNQSLLGDVEIFANKVEGNKIYLTIRLTERPRLTRYEFTGVNKTQSGELEDDVELIRGRIITDALLKNTELNVRNYFVEKGFLNVDIDIFRQKDTLIANGVKLVIAIDKGNKVKIDQINIIGNNELSDPRLESKLKKTNEHLRVTLFADLWKRLWSIRPKQVGQFLTNKQDADLGNIRDYLFKHVKVNFFKSYKFIPDDYKEDKKSLVSFYNSKGFRDAEIVKDSIYAINDKEINVDIYVNEGKKYYFRNIGWNGNYLYPDRRLQTILGIDRGDVYDMELLEKRLQFNPQGADISSLYMDNGYLFFNINPVEVRVEEDSIDVEMRIYEGQQATINKIIIQGNDRTNEHVIRREIRTMPGDKFNRSLLIRTNRELAQLGYFDPEQIGIQPMPNPNDGTVDIQFDLVERSNDQIELSGGWGGLWGFVGTLGVTFNNFSSRELFNWGEQFQLPVGDGQRLSLRGQWNGRSIQSYNFSFTEPWLGGNKPNSLTVSLNYTILSDYNPFQRNQVNAGQLNNGGVTVSLGRRLKWPDNYFQQINSLSLTQYRLENFSGTRMAGTRALGFSTGVSNAITYNHTISRNSIDQPFYPRGGSNISLSTTLTPPYSLFTNINYEEATKQQQNRWQEYHKWMFDVSFFNQITEKLVINTRAHLGFIGTYSAGRPIGPFERFTLGGSGFTGMNNFIIGTDIIALRGYEDQSLNPSNSAFLPEGFNSPELLQGGVVFSKYVMEIRYPISLNPSATVFVLGYGEAGNNWYNYERFSPFDLYKSAGLGARIFLPAFGLLGIDWGYGFDRLPGQQDISGSQFHFTIGQQIR